MGRPAKSGGGKRAGNSRRPDRYTARMKDLTPREIVNELNRHIIGQENAKRAVAVAVRNRWRRQQLDPDLAREVMPKNIIMLGPTGVGKTEIARRLARLVRAPFLKVEASKFTEVGYHGRDVESMIRDLLELAMNMVRDEQAVNVREQAEARVEERLVSMLLGEMTAETTRDSPPHTPAHAPGAPGVPGTPGDPGEVDEHERASESSGPVVGPGTGAASGSGDADERDAEAERARRVRERMKQKLREGFFDDREIEISVREKQSAPILGMMGQDQLDPAMSSMLEKIMPDQTKRRRVTVSRARAILLEEETDKLIDNEKLVEHAIERTQQSGIIFLDEIDKVAAPSSGKSGSADVSREGVQRDLLPIVEGSSVNTRHGVVQTDQILFIAAGAFHTASVSDLMPELQGRFPIRVELDALTREDFKRILTEPDAALTDQQKAMLGAEGMTIEFAPDAIDAMAELAAEANASMENIGARRLMTVIECVFEEISFDAPDMVGRGEKTLTVTAEFVRQRLATIMKDEDLSRFVL